MITKDPKVRRLRRVRGKLSKNLGIPRLTVFRSNSYVWAQIIDDKHGRTLVSATSRGEKKGTKTEQSRLVGQKLAKSALIKKISHVKFDRGLYRYHGRVKALAEGSRQGGLIF